jgi:predicted lipoprotein with Yx(FWY)xxD motif
MRMFIRATAAAFASLALAGVAAALPPGVTEADGAFIAPDGKPLYTFARDAQPGKSMCNNQCAAAWPPLAAAEGAVAEGDWTIITRDDGSTQWAYKGKPLYTFARDVAGAPASGVSANWPLAVK